MILFDSHCHLDDERFNEDRENVILDITQNGPANCMCVGSDLASSKRCIALSRQYPLIYAACGVHPHEAKDAPEDYLQQLEELLTMDKVCALGEIGLDYYYDLSPRDVQKRVMCEQMELAVRIGKPVIFHIRDAHGDAIEIFRSFGKLPEGIIHCFSGSAETAKEYLRMGFYISFAGPVTFKKAPHLWEAAEAVPLDRLLIETDSPYLAPEPVRGRRNDPRNVKYIAEKLAQIKQVSADELAEITFENAKRIYRI